MIIKTVGKYKLAQPLDVKEDNEWVPIPKIARTVPFGYEVDEDDPHILQPIQKELDLLEKAKRYLRQYPSRQVAHWLSESSGRYISHVGLLKRIKNEQRNKTKAAIYGNWARYAEKARQAAEKLETQRIGSRKPSN